MNFMNSSDYFEKANELKSNKLLGDVYQVARETTEKLKTKKVAAFQNYVRPSWTEYFMKIAELAATRSTCLRRHVGACLVKDKKILATGYNGAPAKCIHCNNIGCVREELNIQSGKHLDICRAVHAEANCIAQCSYHGIATKDSILYCTTFPCASCVKLLINAGIKTIYYHESYMNLLSENLLQESNIEVIKC